MFSTIPRFVCTHPGCGASYARKEHLIRHADQHNQTREIICNECGMSFSRSDSLRRHTKLHSATQSGDPVDRVARACDLCHALKCKCDRNNPCAACARRGRRCTFNRFAHENVAVTRSSSVVSGYGTDQSQRKRRRVDADPSDLDMDLSMNQVPSLVVSEEEVSEHHLRTALRHQESQIRNDLTNVPDNQQQNRKNRPRLSLRLSDVFNLSNHFVAGNDYAATHDAREMNTYMSTIDVQHYVDLFFDYVHPRWPFLYREGFRAESEQPILVLAVAMFGMWITEEAQLMKLAWIIRARLRVIFETQMENWAVHDTDSTRTSRWPIVTYQAILLFIIFSMTAHDGANEFDHDNDNDDENETDIHRIHSIFTHLARTCRAQGVLHYPAMLAQISIDDPIVFKFTNVEEFKCFALTLFKVDHLLSQLILLDSQRPGQEEQQQERNNNRLSISDLQFPLPDSGYLHESPSIREFLRRRERQARDPSVSSTRKSAIVADDRKAMMDRKKNPWICDILGCALTTAEVDNAEQRKQKQKAWLRLGPWLGYIGGLDPGFGSGFT